MMSGGHTFVFFLQAEVGIRYATVTGVQTCALPISAFRAVRQALPEAHLALLAGPAGCEIGRLDPDIDETILYRAPNEDVYFQLPQDPQRELAAGEALKEHDFDAA